MRTVLRLPFDATPSREFSWGYVVFRTGAMPRSVYLSSPVIASELWESLVHYDGYPNDTVVRRGPRYIFK